MFNKSTKNILKHIFSGIVLMVLISPIFTTAATEGCNNGSGEGCNEVSIKVEIKNPFKESTIEGLIKTIIENILMPIGSVVAVLMIMYAGFKYVTAGGDTSKIKEATEALKWSVIGAAILLGAWVISQAISSTIADLKK